MQIFRTQIDNEQYVVATYWLSSSTSLRDAAFALAIGQSIGNPKERSWMETDEMFEKHSCLVLDSEEDLAKKQKGIVYVAFPVVNIDWEEDGMSQLLCHLMGGQMDIDIIQECHLVDIQLPQSVLCKFRGPKYGLTGFRNFTGVQDKPLLGAIVKPKTGMSPSQLLDMVKQLVDGGVNFIKEDEIMANPACCPLKDRVPLVSNYLRDKKVVYAVCINSDPCSVMDRVKQVYSMGANAIHINVWSGLGVYRSIRSLDLPIFMHFQKSGDKVFTDRSHRFHIEWKVICKIAAWSGVDFIHAGMWGGYLSDSEIELRGVFDILIANNVVPALSCGMHAGLVDAITKRFGFDYMANVGGAIHSHVGGSLAGAKAMRQAIDKTHEKEYHQAIAKHGLVV